MSCKLCTHVSVTKPERIPECHGECHLNDSVQLLLHDDDYNSSNNSADVKFIKTKTCSVDDSGFCCLHKTFDLFQFYMEALHGVLGCLTECDRWPCFENGSTDLYVCTMPEITDEITNFISCDYVTLYVVKYCSMHISYNSKTIYFTYKYIMVSFLMYDLFNTRMLRSFNLFT